MSHIDLTKIHKVHFIGIGGIGVSAIARMMLHLGKKVSGSDNSPSEITEELKKLGVEVVQGHKAENIKDDVGLVVYTAAVPKENPEFVEAVKKNILILSYGDMLGVVSKGKKVIAVSGTHGKTTTTAMLAEILMKGGLQPTVVVGSLLLNPRTNFVPGTSDLFVTEADEYKKSFSNLSPFILIITNIDLDHLDFYKDLADIQNAFAELVEKIPEDGFLICNMTHPHSGLVVARAKCIVLDYASLLDFPHLKVPGKHNRENAKAAACAASVLGVSPESIDEALKEFKGTWRRFEYKGLTKNGTLVYDDYAHNPHKVRAALSGAREMFPDRKITVVFQPHLYSRTKLLLEEFANSFADADRVLITPIYAAREQNDPSISSQILAGAIQKNSRKGEVVKNMETLHEDVESLCKKDEILIFMGAGDLYKIAEKMIQKS